MNTQLDTLQFDLEPIDSRGLAELCGQFNEHLRQIENRLGIRIRNRGQTFDLSGDEQQIRLGKALLEQLHAGMAEHDHLTPDFVHLLLQETGMDLPEAIDSNSEDASSIVIRTRKGLVRPRGKNQQQYVKTITSNDINFGIGPAGTGKTFLAVACAVQALEQEEVQRILLVRPAVEAGEKLGFLPGDLAQKIDPYLRPLYDALYEMIGFDRVIRLIEKNVIEIAPLAYMRGRTLNNAYIILDESQNTTMEQMKMFLTRIGFGSTAVITGDITQVDLPRNVRSGLRHAMEVLDGVQGIGITRFNSRDVVRHPLVQRIVEAYDDYEQAGENKAGQDAK